MLSVDEFFNSNKYLSNNDYEEITNKNNSRCIKSLTFDEASDVYGISSKDEIDFRKRIYEKYKE